MSGISTSLVTILLSLIWITLPSDAGQEHDISSSFDRSLQAKEEGHPKEVETELDRVQSCTLLPVESTSAWPIVVEKRLPTLVNSTVCGLNDAMPVVHALYAEYPIKPYNAVHMGPNT